MAHNITTINDLAQNRESSISASGGVIAVGRGESNAYSNSPATNFNADTTLYFYDSSPINTISGATISSSSNWIDSITLPAGDYMMTAVFSPTFSASGVLEYCWQRGTSSTDKRAPIARVGATTLATWDSGGVIQLRISESVSIDYRVVAHTTATNINTVANQGNAIAEQSFIFIEQLS